MDKVIALFDEVADLVCIADAEGALLFVNRAGRRVLGIGAFEDLCGRKLLDLCAEGDGALLMNEAMPAAAREGSWHGRTILFGASGHVHATVSVVARPALLGGPGGVVVTMKLLDDALTRTRIESLLNASRVVLYACRANDWAVSYMSENVLGQLGYPASEFVRDPHFWTDRVHPDDAPQLLADLAGSFEKGYQTHEYRFRHGDGEWRWVYDEVVLVKDRDGQDVEYVGAWQDVTERKEAERLIQEQSAALAQFSTPLVPITDDVLVMPLIGSLDTRRAEQVIHTLLEGVGKTQARTAILDITGVALVDTQVADALLRAAKAVSLLGAQVVITGIRSEVAQTLVQLGANMGDVVTRATLQAGVAYAMRGRPWAGAGAKAGERPRPTR